MCISGCQRNAVERVVAGAHLMRIRLTGAALLPQSYKLREHAFSRWCCHQRATAVLYPKFVQCMFDGPEQVLKVSGIKITDGPDPERVGLREFARIDAATLLNQDVVKLVEVPVWIRRRHEGSNDAALDRRILQVPCGGKRPGAKLNNLFYRHVKALPKITLSELLCAALLPKREYARNQKKKEGAPIQRTF